MPTIKPTARFLLSFLLFLVSCRSKEKQETVTFSQEIIPVKIIPIASLEDSSTITSTGLLGTVNEARYSFKVAGIVDHININEGQFFKKGQLLATLKSTEIDAQVSQANIALEKAERDYTRFANLYRDSVATLEQLQNSKTNVETARKIVDAMQFNKKYSYIRATSDGFVAKKLANEGEVLSAGMPVLAINETAGNSDWILRSGITDREWALIKIGAEATVILDAFPGKIFPASVFRKSQAADISDGSFQVELKIVLGNIRPAVGMFGRASIKIEWQGSLATIPYDALLEADGNNAFVFVPIENNKVKKIPVIIESFNNKEIVIKSGLENISSIVVSNSAFLNEKSTISIIK